MGYCAICSTRRSNEEKWKKYFFQLSFMENAVNATHFFLNRYRIVHIS